MRQVVGKSTSNLDSAAFAELRARYSGGVVVDLGTGDGKHVLTQARRRPDTLVVGVDASPDAMRRASARAAAKPARGGAPNAIFLWASVHDLPSGLDHVSEVHALMPWGSLLHVLVQPDVDVLRDIGRRCVGSATFLVTLNLHAWRPPVPEVRDIAEPTPDWARAELAPAYAEAGWSLHHADYLDAGQAQDLGTSWTKRLASSRAELDVLALRGTL